MGDPTEEMNMRGFFLVIAALLIAGCGSTRKTSTGPPASTEDAARAYESSFRPSDHDPQTQRTIAPILSAPETSAVAVPPEPVELASLDMIQGYRVQVFSSTSIDEARAKKTEMDILVPDEWFYLEYESPSYKIRAGNFATRFEADRFARMLLEKGYADCWAVPRRIYRHPPKKPVVVNPQEAIPK
jgi:hypothetical protein